MSAVQDLKAKYDAAKMFQKLIYINAAVFLLVFTIKLFFLEKGSYLYTTGMTLKTTGDASQLIYRPWSILTHMFMHTGLFHIFFNMVFLYFLGGMFESRFGARKLLSTYLLGGLSGFVLYFVMAHLLPEWRMMGTAEGASAAVMAIFVAYATYFPNEQIRLILIGPVKLKYLALFYVLFDYISLGGSNSGGHLGHLGGALFGFLLMTQMQKGKDIGAWFEKLLDRIVDLFKKRSNLRVVKAPSKAYKSDEDFNKEKNQRQKKLDRILDKISKGGYDALSKDEKNFLGKFGKDF